MQRCRGTSDIAAQIADLRAIVDGFDVKHFLTFPLLETVQLVVKEPTGPKNAAMLAAMVIAKALLRCAKPSL